MKKDFDRRTRPRSSSALTAAGFFINQLFLVQMGWRKHLANYQRDTNHFKCIRVATGVTQPLKMTAFLKDIVA